MAPPPPPASRPVRACPVCSECGSKRFVRLRGEDRDGVGTVTVRCRSCGRIISI